MFVGREVGAAARICIGSGQNEKVCYCFTEEYSGRVDARKTNNSFGAT
jgi:hypothetical protein